jgi:oligosaccharide repeat unit polymerase
MKKKGKRKIIYLCLIIAFILYVAISGFHQGTILYQIIQIVSNLNNILLLAYAIGFWVVYLLYQRKKKQFDTGSFLYLIFVASSFGSCWYYTQDKVDVSYPRITIFPLVFLFITINICLLPLWKLDTTKVKGINDRGVSPLLNALSIVFIILSILPLASLISHFSLSMLEGSYLSSMYESNEDKAALYFSGISKVSFAFIRRFENVIVVLFFYQIYKNRKDYAIGLSLPMIMFLIFKLMSGSRGGLVGSILLFGCLYLLLKNCLTKEVQNKINRIGIVLCAIFIAMLAAISISRFGQQNNNPDITIDRWISQYLGESAIRFTDTVWYTDRYMYGNQNFILLRKILGLPTIDDYDMFMAHWEGTLHFPVNVFYTFIGDVYLDFGRIGSCLFALSFCWCFSKLLKNKCYFTIPQLIILSIFFNYLGFGFAANVYRTIFNQKDMIWLLLLTLVIYLVQGATKVNSPILSKKKQIN